MKMRVLYKSGKKKIINIASMITEKYATEKVNCMDKIPPAYSCDKERLVVMLVSTGKDPENSLVLFCRELTKLRAANVAFIVDGAPEGANTLVNAVKEAGANVFDEVLYINGGLPFIGGSVKPDEEKKINEFMDKVMANLV